MYSLDPHVKVAGRLEWEAMHSCNHKWCLQPLHLYWGTRMQNHYRNQEEPYASLVNEEVEVPQPQEGEQPQAMTTMHVLWEARRQWMIDNEGNGPAP